MKKSLLLSFIFFLTLSNILHSQTCGGIFTDTGGPAENYSNNTNQTITIFPTIPGDVVTVTFTAFNTQALSDVLYVFNGNTVTSTQIGAYSGTAIPGPITSSSADGSLTFNFSSNGTTTAAGWIANITCGLPPTCTNPTTLTTSSITSNSVFLNWTEHGNATTWECIALPVGSPAPTAATTGFIFTATNHPFNFNGLSPNTCYTFYVRAVCSPTDKSTWSMGIDACTLTAPPVCGGNFVDAGGVAAAYAPNSNATTTICPASPGDVVTATFTSFNTEATFDALYVYNGTTVTPANMIPSNNPAGSVPGGLAGGYWGTALPCPFTSSSADGCLTFVFRCDGSVQNPGWISNITCGPPPACTVPLALISGTITHNSAILNWTQPANANSSIANAWQLVVLPCGSPAPGVNPANIVNITASTTYTLTGLNAATCYDIYIRANCGPTTSAWICKPATITTLVAPPACGGQFLDNGGVAANYTANANVTTTICPTNPGERVTVTFSEFNTEATWDGLYVFDGNTVTAQQILSGNPAGNGALTTAGAFYGNTIPGPFSSSTTDGCLTFNFRSDASAQFPGWVANITCGPPPTCLRPTNLAVSSITENSVVLGWTDNSVVTSWEVLVLPLGSIPSQTSVGQVVTTNPATVSGLTIGTAYSFYVRANCNGGDHSYWSFGSDGATLISNDECTNAIEVPVNGRNCGQIIHGSLVGATASAQPLATTCVGTPNDDVWFKFTATDSSLNVALSNIVGSTTNLNFAVYSGTCNSLVPFYCSPTIQTAGVITNLTVGTTYYLRVYSNASTVQTSTFDVCITIASTCSNSESICGVNNYSNTTGIPSIGTIGCLSTTPNPTYFTLKIADSGPVNLLLTQSDIGSSVPNLDVDYAAWGPFTSPTEACSAISGGQAPGVGVPVTITTGCSYSAAPTETLQIANAQAGQYYIILITNFSNRVGYINVSQSNVNAVGAGSIDCSGIRLNAFLDSNANGTQDSGEPNFPLGQFHYEINNNGNPHSVISPTGSYILYEQVLTNLYDLSYTINSDYNTQYTTPAGFTNVSTSVGAMTVYDFPVTSIQNYNDLGITVVPQSSPRAGFTYTVKVVYTNNGTQTIPTGSLTFNNNIGTTITNISQTGTTTIANGFTYSFTNLLPYETRTIIVTISVPPIPSVALGQLITNIVSIVPPSGDTVANNNTNSSTQAVIGSYDPNDKIEGHGEKILFSSFTANDYLEYTIRFENNGTAGALNVMVNDILDSKLNESTLVMLDASHNYSLDRLGNNLTWKFNNIQLPVAVPNSEIGKGYIKFKIKPKPGYAVGDIIPNTAQIYFDSNPAIVTNTFNTEFVLNLGTQLFTESSIILYPNPANSLVQIALQDTYRNYRYYSCL